MFEGDAVGSGVAAVTSFDSVKLPLSTNVVRCEQAHVTESDV